MSTAAAVPHQRGSLSVMQGAALYVGAVLGTGVIALPALAAAAAGPASLVAWLALVLLSAPLAATFAALGARYPDAGGVSTYVRNAFGPRAAAVVGWCFYFAVPAGAPAAAMFGGAYVAAAFGGGEWTVIGTAAILVFTVTLANALGLTVSGRLQLLLAVLLVALLLAAVIASAPHAQLANLQPFAPHGWLAVFPAAALLVWSFAGWEAITHLAAEFRHPAHDLPLAAGIAVVVVGVLYMGVATMSVMVLGPKAGTSSAPLAELLARGLGGKLHMLAAVAALLLTLGTMNAYFAGAAKLGAALGRDGALPQWLAQGSRAGDVPRRSLFTIAALATLALIVVVIAGVGPRPLVLLTTGSFVTVYALGMAAALRLLPRGSWPHLCARVALVAVAGLCCATGWYLLWPLVITGCALLYLRVRRVSVSSARTIP
ncbi:amino acid permease [Paraburkholderia phymatum]|uniref:Amino acid permease-associated region n=1 Tax=Paraburkholderia phymatum (strain DSM 17167 / CIP 108236 / LMG 21445 / STM815) TaxID=391038 RepID=B2JN48_PARP8|nr:amino acid permease [Paraburkholderia phymatum]ACC72896.1 amino acid permease-associated region [Paraburkholderia phymatum STM815]